MELILKYIKIVAAKCNIVANALKKFTSLIWGVKSCNKVDEAIVENYIEHLDCPTVDLHVCNHGPCDQGGTVTEFDCTLEAGQIFKIEGTGDADIVLQATATGATGPVTYRWTYNATHFDALNGIGESTIQLKLREGFSLSTLVSSVSVKVSDTTECSNEDTIECMIDGGEINCEDNIVPCYRPQNLVVTKIANSNVRYTLTWDNTDLLASSNNIEQRAYYRKKTLGGEFQENFTTSNPFSKETNVVNSPFLTPNVFYEFKVESVCTEGGPLMNGNGLVEAFAFGCLPPNISNTASTSSITLDLVDTDLTKIRGILRRVSDDGIVVNTLAVRGVDNKSTVSASGLNPETAYYWEVYLYATVGGAEAESTLCGPYSVLTSAAVVITCGAVSNLVVYYDSGDMLDLSWNNSNITGNGNVTAVRASKRLRSVGGVFDAIGFAPSNDIPKGFTSAILIVDPNKVYQFKVESICTEGGPVENTNGVQEGIRFECIAPFMSSTKDTVTVEVDVSGTDISKLGFTLAEIIEGVPSQVDVATVTLPNNEHTFVGLESSKEYIIYVELFAVVNGVETSMLCTGGAEGYKITTLADPYAGFTHQAATITAEVKYSETGIYVELVFTEYVPLEDTISLFGNLEAGSPGTGVISRAFSVNIMAGQVTGQSEEIYQLSEEFSGGYIRDEVLTPTSSKAMSNNVIYDFTLEIL